LTLGDQVNNLSAVGKVQARFDEHEHVALWHGLRTPPQHIGKETVHRQDRTPLLHVDLHAHKDREGVLFLAEGV